MQKFSIGCDIEENSRFEEKTLEKDKAFLDRIFTPCELEYCFKYKNPSPHLCARFCAKEAVVKAFGGFNINDVYYSDIEILKNENGSIEANVQKHPDFNIAVSISHCKNYSAANVLITVIEK